MTIRVDLLDAPAYSPPYDHALAAALAQQGARVKLLTSAFAYGTVPPADGYELQEFFYGRARGAAGSKLRTVSKLAVHVQDMLRYRSATDADLVHVQWLTLPGIDLKLLPDLPTVLTIHDPLSRGPLPGPAPDLRRVDAVVVHSEYARSVVLAQHSLDPGQVHMISHGVLGAPDAEPASLPPELPDSDLPVVLCFGLLRPYKGVETLLKAWNGITGAQLWIVGRPMMDLAALIAEAPATVSFVPRFVTVEEEAAIYRRADIAVLPYERSDRFGFSGVLATALGYGKAIVVSDVGGLAQVTEFGAASSVPPGDADALRVGLQGLIDDPAARGQLSQAALAAGAGPYSWNEAARRTLALYNTILGSR